MTQPTSDLPAFFDVLPPSLIKPPGVLIPTAHESYPAAARHLLLCVNEWVRRRAPEFFLQDVSTWHGINRHEVLYSLRIRPPANWCALRGHTMHTLASAWSSDLSYLPYWEIVLSNPSQAGVLWQRMSHEGRRYGISVKVLSLQGDRCCLSAASLCNALAYSLAEVALWGLWRAGLDQGLFAVDPLDPVSWEEISRLGSVPMNLEVLTADSLQRWVYGWLQQMRSFLVEASEETPVILAPDSQPQVVPTISVGYTSRTWKIALARRNVWNWGRRTTIAFRETTAGRYVDYLHCRTRNEDLNDGTYGVRLPVTLQHGLLNHRWLRQLLDSVLEGVTADLLSVCEELGFSAPEHEEEDKHAYSAF